MPELGAPLFPRWRRWRTATPACGFTTSWAPRTSCGRLQASPLSSQCRWSTTYGCAFRVYRHQWSSNCCSGCCISQGEQWTRWVRWALACLVSHLGGHSLQVGFKTHSCLRRRIVGNSTLASRSGCFQRSVWRQSRRELALVCYHELRATTDAMKRSKPESDVALAAASLTLRSRLLLNDESVLAFVSPLSRLIRRSLKWHKNIFRCERGTVCSISLAVVHQTDRHDSGTDQRKPTTGVWGRDWMRVTRSPQFHYTRCFMSNFWLFVFIRRVLCLHTIAWRKICSIPWLQNICIFEAIADSVIPTILSLYLYNYCNCKTFCSGF